MRLTYETMQKFMQDYFADFNRYAGDAETIHKMSRYWAPNFKATIYFNRKGRDYPITYSTRKEFQDFLHKTHRGMKNSLNPLEFVIDEKAKKVVILIKMVKIDIQTGAEIEIFGMGSYQLIVCDDNTFKIDRLHFIFDAPGNIKKSAEVESFIYAF